MQVLPYMLMILGFPKGLREELKNPELVVEW